MKPILLVFTGGTIGSRNNAGTIDTDSEAGFSLIERFRARYPGQEAIRFETLTPLQILSENLHPSAWTQIIEAIESTDLSRFEGIIVTHGTDTLAFTAAILGLYFHALPIPLLLVSSDRPLEHPLANGVANFICAVEFIRQKITRGAFVAYQNPNQPMQIHLATRVCSCLPLSSDFISVQSQPFMQYENGRFVILNPIQEAQGPGVSLRAKFGRILVIRPYPGLDYTRLDLTGADAVLHDLYHSGTACVTTQWGEQHSLTVLSDHCQRRAIPLYLAPAVFSKNAYSSTRTLLAHDTTMLWNMSIEAAFAKLSLAYGNLTERDKINEYLACDCAHEHIAPNQSNQFDEFEKTF